jgi:hypothetical protein
MRQLLLFGLLGFPLSLLAQGARDSVPKPRFVTLTAGFGNTQGGVGIQAEKYFAKTRLSVFGAIGYTPAENEGDYKGAGVAGGVRGFTPGVKHRGFLELSVSSLFIEQSCFDVCSARYGPGLSAGWQMVTRGGFTLWLSGGIGVAFRTDPGDDSVAPVGGIGLGYTWRRSP